MEGYLLAFLFLCLTLSVHCHLSQVIFPHKKLSFRILDTVRTMHFLLNFLLRLYTYFTSSFCAVIWLKTLSTFSCKLCQFGAFDCYFHFLYIDIFCNGGNTPSWNYCPWCQITFPFSACGIVQKQMFYSYVKWLKYHFLFAMNDEFRLIRPNIRAMYAFTFYLLTCHSLLFLSFIRCWFVRWFYFCYAEIFRVSFFLLLSPSTEIFFAELICLVLT